MSKSVFGILVILIVSCHTVEKREPVIASTLSVHWELTTNFTDRKNVFAARFDLTNGGDIDLDDKNWALFFSMSPRLIVDDSVARPARLHHINGDWYKLTPEKNFSLPKGKAITVVYHGVEAIIKETDRPMGLYVVYYNAGGQEDKILEVTGYTWTPFTTPEQINRSADDAEPIPTPGWTYKNNAGLSELPEAQWQRLIPNPVRLQAGEGTFGLTADVRICHQDQLGNEANYLGQKLREITGVDYAIVPIVDARLPGKSIVLNLDTAAASRPESYSLSITRDEVVISGGSPAGVFYGVQTLRALIPIEAYRSRTAAFSLPQLTIHDQPRFSFRGLHLDVSRNFQTKETILRTLDLLAFYKINRFLLYTTEDEGWRLEINGLPELTGAGAQRGHTPGKEAPALHPAYGSGPFFKQEGKHGHGYYSRQDFIDILRYASARHIKVIPEVNFPGHARAAIKAMEARYERLMKEGKEAEANEYRLIDPDDKSVYLSAQGYTDNVVCVARESVFHFYEKVVDEIGAMYREAGLRLDEFHTGGDEVPEGAWTQSPLAAGLLSKHPEIKDPKNLQAYFFRELVKRLKHRGLQVDGWEEVALMKTAAGKYAVNPEFAGQRVVPFIWNNLFDYDLGYRLANAGYPVVLCNVSNFYFDLAYTKDPTEPGLYWAGFVDTRHAYTFSPYDMFKTTSKSALGQKIDLEAMAAAPGRDGRAVLERLKPEARKNIIGLEAQLWSETIKGRDMMEYYLLPKLIGFAESAWAPARDWETADASDKRQALIQTQWNAFANTLARRELPRLHYLNGGYNYRVPPPGATLENGELHANTEYPGLMICYTTDGTEPTETSRRYEKPVHVTGEIRLRSFDAAGGASKTVRIEN